MNACQLGRCLKKIFVMDEWVEEIGASFATLIALGLRVAKTDRVSKFESYSFAPCGVGGFCVESLKSGCFDGGLIQGSENIQFIPTLNRYLSLICATS